MRVAPFVAVAWVFVHGCGARPPHERAVIEYVEAIRANDCERAFSLLSARLQAALREDEQQQRDARHRAGPAVAPRELYCAAGPYSRVKLQKTRTAWLRAGEAEVHLIEAVPAGHLVPGFWPTRTDYEPKPFAVVLEGANWRVDDRRLLAELERRAGVRQAVREERAKAEEWNRRLGLTRGSP